MLRLLYLMLTRFAEVKTALDKQNAALARIEAEQARQAQVLEQHTVRLQQIAELITETPQATTLLLIVTKDGETFEGVTNMRITDTQKFSITLDARDAKGNPAALDGPATFTSSNPDVLAVTPAADGLSAEVVAVGPLGSGQITVVADAKIGPEVKEITGQIDLEVIAGEATTLTLNTSEVSEQ